MDTAIIFDLTLIHKYDQAGPRYTSYPTAVQFHDGFGADEYREQAIASNASGRPLSLYFHIPFCDTVCFYCACNKIVTKNRRHTTPYLDHLYRELALQGALFNQERPVTQLHWGGGTPTFINSDEMRELMRVTGEHFHLLDSDSGEYSIEVDPRETDDHTVALLRELGFNRLSLGVQDFDPQVQKAVNRLQSKEITLKVMEAARHEGFKSISVDLIYGLPHQSVAGFSRTVAEIIAQNPDRISVFNYAHLPELFKTQRQIDASALPPPAVKLEILKAVIEQLTAASYVYIGMDHFAKPDDELALAQQAGTLYRNFQGYSTHADCDLIGFGATSIGMVGDSYSQNLKGLEEYYAQIDDNRLAVFRGVRLNADDRLRRAVITALICNFTLEFAAIERQYAMVFGDYFAMELAELTDMQADGLLKLDTAGIRVLPPGRLLIRNICMVFDRYLRAQKQQRFSRVI
ncbi:oxygen-independent coproporphyrinogen III oxidase [Candidatus Contendibacter odensensis]|uniref:Coproporphyrinogen-III oxidase n=1 Tax=Candidatus Contendobacter odensis Run_B_J11 TaxID=1400861 RepID=A0A7U7G955_9GAMM|nr:oxygen-independent coproporphyrinogen III oxidase [Candidatus Contendobacter odensis]CDH44193.1 Oxygen-independent coproporphyrinogen-III oxidase [Candidatus Contendobacter odensis Run_B_J11]